VKDSLTPEKSTDLPQDIDEPYRVKLYGVNPA